MAKLALDRDGAYPAYQFLQMAEEPAAEEEAIPPVDVGPTMAPAELPKRPKCAMGEPNCPRLEDAVSLMVSQIWDQLTVVRKHIANTTFHCDAQSANYQGQIDEWTATGDEAQVKLAKAIDEENTASEEMRGKVEEFHGLAAELADKLKECNEKIV